MFNVLWLLLGFLPSARPFAFTTSTPSECNPFTLSWTGGNPPFTALLTLLDNTPYNISIPTSAYNGLQGTFSFPLTLSFSQQFIVTMSDASGFATGGSTPVLTTGSGSSSCNTTNPGNAFYFGFGPATPLVQCGPFVFTEYSVGSIPPVTIIGTVPGGTSFVLTPPIGSINFTWTADAAYNTVLIFSMFDSRGRSGGASGLVTVDNSADSTCLNAQSPSATIAQGPSSTGTPSASSPHSGIRLSSGAIAGIVIGSLAFLAIVIIIGFFLGRRKQKTDHSETDTTYHPGINSYYSTTTSTSTPGDNLYYHPVSLADEAQNRYQPGAYAPPPAQLPIVPLRYQQTLTAGIPTSIGPDSTFNPYQPGQPESLPPPSSGAIQSIHLSEDSLPVARSQRKALQMYNAQTQVMVHTDAEDHPAPNTVMIELPPQYKVPQGVGQYQAGVTVG